MTMTPEQTAAFTQVLRSRGRRNTHYDISRAANIIAQQAAEIERLREALKAVRYRMDMLGGFDNRFTLRKLVNAALNGGPDQ